MLLSEMAAAAQSIRAVMGELFIGAGATAGAGKGGSGSAKCWFTKSSKSYGAKRFSAVSFSVSTQFFSASNVDDLGVKYAKHKAGRE